MGSFLEVWAPDRVAVVRGGEEFQFGSLREQVEILASNLSAYSERGTSIGLRLRNGPEIIIAYLAVWRSGRLAIPILPKVPEPELRSMLSNTNCSCLLTHRDDLAAVHGLKGSTVPLAIENLLEPSTTEVALREPPTEESPAVVFHTSGSTRGPKGVVLSHKNLGEALQLFNMPSIRSALGTPKTYLNIAGMTDTVGCLHSLWTLMNGGRVIALEEFEPSDFRRALREFRPSHTTLFLPQAVALASADLQPDELSSLDMLCIAGDKTPERVLWRYRELGIVPITGYGLTESFVVALETSESLDRSGALGEPVPGVEVRIEVEGRTADAYEVGEILVRSPQNALGYWNAPADTALAFQDGWLWTGDLGHFDAQGCLWFSTRRKQIIVRGGENISPQEIEETLVRHPAVELACVLGAPDPLAGEVPLAWVSLKPGYRATPEALQAFLEAQLVDFKVPQQIEIRSELPLGRTGKVDRQILKSSIKS